MLRVLSILAAAAAAGVLYFLVKLYQMRTRMNGLPSTPRKYFLIGNIDIPTDCAQHFPPDAHPHCYYRYIEKKYGARKFMYQDWWPFAPQWLLMNDPEIISKYITTDQSLPKSYMESNFLDMFLGANNMVSIEGAHWKTLRSAFNPGFAPAHLMTLVPYIVDACMTFNNVLARLAKSNELFEMEEISTRLTIDIIGKVGLDIDMDTQKTPHQIVKLFRARAEMMPGTTNPANPFSGLSLTRPVKLWWNGRQLDGLLGDEVDKKVAARADDGTSTNSEKSTKAARKRSIVDLALDQYQKDLQATGKKISATTMPPSVRVDIIDSLKTFIFAGHDTTASTTSYIFYQLHCHPQAQARVVSELNAVLGSNPADAADVLKSDPHCINKLDYTTAVIKEVLRLHPPASTMRMVPLNGPEFYFTDPDQPGKQFPLNGFHIWPPAIWTHRNEEFFPEPTKFVPERFLQNETPYKEAKLFTPAGKDAFRPFEKGPRHCIGQPLAMLELQIICALSLRSYDFVAEYDGIPIHEVHDCESVDEYASGEGVKNVTFETWGKRKTIEGHRAYQILKAAAKPAEGMPGRVYLIKQD